MVFSVQFKCILLTVKPSALEHDQLNLYVFLLLLLQESYPSTPPIWFVDSDDPSLAEVLERLEDVRKGSTLVRWLIWLLLHIGCFATLGKCNLILLLTVYLLDVSYSFYSS